MNCPTIKVKFDNEQGFYVINESDFDGELHVKYSEKPIVKKSPVKKSAK